MCLLVETPVVDIPVWDPVGTPGEEVPVVEASVVEVPAEEDPVEEPLEVPEAEEEETVEDVPVVVVELLAGSVTLNCWD